VTTAPLRRHMRKLWRYVSNSIWETDGRTDSRRLSVRRFVTSRSDVDTAWRRRSRWTLPWVFVRPSVRPSLRWSLTLCKRTLSRRRAWKAVWHWPGNPIIPFPFFSYSCPHRVSSFPLLGNHSSPTLCLAAIFIIPFSKLTPQLPTFPLFPSSPPLHP